MGTQRLGTRTTLDDANRVATIAAARPLTTTTVVGTGTHGLVSAFHTAAGLTIGQFLRALSATSFGFAAIQAGDLPATAVAPGEYGDGQHVVVLTVDQQGRITAASEVEIAVGGGGDPVFQVDGALVAATQVGTYICPRTATIQAVYIYCKDPGSASSTIVDVHLNGTTIFTTQGNRPTLAYDDANQVAKSGTPNTTSLVENDVLTVDIDQVATGAETLVVVIAIQSSGGGGGSSNDTVEATATTTDDTPTTIYTIHTETDHVYAMWIGMIVAHRTGGSSGAANDMAVYVGTGWAKNNGGAITHTIQFIANYEDQSGWSVTVSVVGTNILIQVNGAVNNNISWALDIRNLISV